MIVIPLFPLFVEAMKNRGSIRGESVLLTGAVLAATFGFTSEGNLFRAAYMLLFLASVGYDFHPDINRALPAPAGVLGWIFDHPAIDLLTLVGLVDAMERFIWHHCCPVNLKRSV
ncbi:MAG TPA: hypothetical protein VGG99_20040 [Acetobacteraceae bacterium]|jgi:hypothetical protein